MVILIIFRSGHNSCSYYHTMSTPIDQQGKFAKCGSCYGTGREIEMDEITCPDCAGTGYDKNTEIWAALCSRCNGRGKITVCRPGNRPCRVCNGSGFLEY